MQHLLAVVIENDLINRDEKETREIARVSVIMENGTTGKKIVI